MNNVVRLLFGLIVVAFACDQKAGAQTTEHPNRKLPYTTYDVDAPFQHMYRVRTEEGADCYVLEKDGQIFIQSMSCVKVMRMSNGYTEQPL